MDTNIAAVIEQLLACCKEASFVLNAYGSMCRKHTGGLPPGYHESHEQLHAGVAAAEALTTTPTQTRGARPMSKAEDRSDASDEAAPNLSGQCRCGHSVERHAGPNVSFLQECSLCDCCGYYDTGIAESTNPNRR